MMLKDNLIFDKKAWGKDNRITKQDVLNKLKKSAKGPREVEEKKLSRNHTENLLKNIGADIKIKKFQRHHLISLRGQQDLNSFNLEPFGS